MSLRTILSACDEVRKSFGRLDALQTEELDFIAAVVKNLTSSNGQLFQDIWALYETGFKRDGYFVEFGACDGIDCSNTYLLEKAYGWTGILAEPARSWINALVENRSCHISRKCVYKSSGEKLMFNEVGVLSTIDSYSGSDVHAQHRIAGTRNEVEAISLNDLLAEHGAPTDIDFMSIDTEGSELDILSTLNFEKYRVKLISVEHNYTIQRDEIFKFLTWKGYVRKFPKLSHFDDWYVLARGN